MQQTIQLNIPSLLLLRLQIVSVVYRPAGTASGFVVGSIVVVGVDDMPGFAIISKSSSRCEDIIKQDVRENGKSRGRMRVYRRTCGGYCCCGGYPP